MRHQLTVDGLLKAAEGSRLMARAALAVAAEFRDDFDRALAEENGPRLALLRPYVLDKEREAKAWGEDARLLETAADALWNVP